MGSHIFPVAQQFFNVMKEYDPSTPQVLDNNDLSTSHAYSVSVASCGGITTDTIKHCYTIDLEQVGV